MTIGFRSSVVLVGLCGSMCISTLGASAQAPDAVQPPAAAQPAATPQAALPSATLQPAFELLQAVLDSTSLEKWKTTTQVRNETQNNLASIQRDMAQTLPGLATAADTAPITLSKVMPLYRNVEALYDVLLRVDAVARQSAPQQQATTVGQALSQLDSSRISMGKQIQSMIEAQERHSADLDGQLKAALAVQATPAPVAVCTPPPAPAPKKKPAAKPKPPAAASSTTTTQPH